MNKRYVFILFWLLIVFSPLYGEVNQSHSIVASFLQLKEQYNLGTVFNGAQLEYRYGLHWKIHDHEILYQPKLGFGIVFNNVMMGEEGGMKGYQANISPVNVSWIAPFPRNWPFYEHSGHAIKLGLNFAMNYSYQAYLDLHGGNMFWASEIGFSPIIQYQYQWNNKRIGIGLQNSLFGFTSHTQKKDLYFYHFFALNAPDWFKKPHEDMQLGSFNKYNHTNVSIEFSPNIQKRHSFLYEFDFFSTFYGMQFKRMNHNIIWKVSV